MSAEVHPSKPTDTVDAAVDQRNLAKASESRQQGKTRKRKVMSQINIWIRRIHLFSGLFMLPWVLLYGFTALLFNHPTYFTDSKTEIQNFQLPEDDFIKLPSAKRLASLAVETANGEFSADSAASVLKISDEPRAMFTRQGFGSVENSSQSVGVIIDLNNGKGYLRKRQIATDSSESGNSKESPKSLVESLDEGVELAVPTDAIARFRDGVAPLFASSSLNADDLKIRSLPNLEFDGVLDGQPVRLRLTSLQNRRRGDDALDQDKDGPSLEYKSKLAVVGRNPREMSARSFLLRLHTAHGYGIRTNSRWFWAIAVDLMFASMCFWGISGVVMWWQIKRTRRIGFALLIASAIAATWLAIGMHWQLVNG